MKKIYVSIFIFLLLIGISSFSFATYVNWSHYDTYDSSNINFTAPTQQNFQDLIDLSHTLILSWGYDEIIDFENSEILMYLDPSYFQGPCIYLFYYNPPSVAYSRSNSSSIEFLIDHNTSRPNFIFAFCFISTGYYRTPYTGYNDDTWSGSDYNNVMVGSSSTPTYYYSTQDIQSTRGNINILASNTSLSVTNPFNSSSGGEEGGGDNGETEEGGILDFITNFWSNLLHIVVPTEEQWDELQENWENNVLSKFNIQAWTFNENDYNYSNSNEWQNNDAPEIPINILGGHTNINMQSINTWLNTPFNFGKKKLRYSSNDVVMETTIDNGGLTIRKLLILSMTIDIFLLNIYLFNKFFAKED